MILGGCNHDGLLTRPLHSLSAFRMEDEGVGSLSFRMVSLYFSSSKTARQLQGLSWEVSVGSPGPVLSQSGRVVSESVNSQQKRLCGWEALEKSPGR